MTDATDTRPRAPFDDADADIVLRSADGVDFRLYKVILAKASPVFRGMFTLPDSHPPGEPQVVTMTEDADTLYNLLRLCYPVDCPSFTSLDQISSVLAAAMKYDMPAVGRHILRLDMDPFLQTSFDTMRVYLLACAYKHPSLARRAARLLLDDPKNCDLDFDHMPPELRTVPCEFLYNLAAYRRACCNAALRTVRNRHWVLCGDHSHPVRGVSPEPVAWIWMKCGDCAATPLDKWHASIQAHSRSPPYIKEFFPRAWWLGYIQRVEEMLSVRIPFPLTLTLENIIGPALVDAGSCRTCRSKAYEELKEFGQALTTRIQAAVDQGEVLMRID